MKINIESKNYIQAKVIVEKIQDIYEQKASEFFKLTYSSQYEIGKKTFNEYAFHELIDKYDLYGFASQIIKFEKEHRSYKALYKKNYDYLHKTDGALYGRDVYVEMDWVAKVYKFLKPIVAEKMEQYCIRTNFIEKCTWLDEFKQEFAPITKLFKNLKLY